MAAETHCRVSGVWQKVKEIHVKVSTTWQKCKEVYCRVAGVWQKVYVNDFVPAGVILLRTTTGAVPGGWTAVSSSYNDRFIRGCTTGGTALAVAGATSYLVSATSTSAGSHLGNTISWGSANRRVGNTTHAGHTHSVSATLSAYYPWVRATLVQASVDTQTIPAGVSALTHLALGTAGGVVDTSNISTQFTTHTGKCMLHNATVTNVGTTGGTTAPTATCSVVASSHNHGLTAGQRVTPSGEGGIGPSPTSVTADPSHAHTSTATGALNFKRRRLLPFGNASASWSARKGMIGLWSGTQATIPAGWSFCNGTNGTPDMRDYMLEISNTTSIGVAAGSNSLSMSGTLASNGSHHHQTSTQDTDSVEAGSHSNLTGAHTHTYSGSATMTPYRVDLNFIMKTA